jgi:hypothetical protein
MSTTSRPAPASPRVTTRRPTVALRLGTIAALAALLAGCGTTAASTLSGSSPTSTTATGAAGFTAYRQCLQHHGVTLPTGPPTADRFDGTRTLSPADQAARQACAALRPSGGFRGANASALAAFRSCMRAHGVTLPTPTARPSTSSPVAPGQRGPGFLGGLSTTDPTVAKALAVCRVLLPVRPSGGSPTTSPTG